MSCRRWSTHLEVWHVPSIQNRGLISVFPVTVNVLFCALGLGRVTFAKNSEVIAEGITVSKSRRFQIRFRLFNQGLDPKSLNNVLANLTVAVSVLAVISFL